MIPSLRLAPGALALAATALLVGCASPPTRFFTLDPVAPAQPLASGYAGPPLKVLAVHIPPVLDREELVQEGPAGEIKVHDFEHWSAPLGLTARQVLVQDLAARLAAGEVLGPDSPGGPQVATLSVDVVAFSAGPAGASLQASWSATLPARPGSTAAPVMIRSPLQQLQGPPTTTDGAGAAQAFSALLGQLADQIAATAPARMQAAMAEAAARDEAAREAAARAAAQAAAAPRGQTTTRTRTTATQRSSAQPF